MKQLYISVSEAQDEWLDNISTKNDVSKGKVVRDIIQTARGGDPVLEQEWTPPQLEQQLTILEQRMEKLENFETRLENIETMVNDLVDSSDETSQATEQQDEDDSTDEPAYAYILDYITPDVTNEDKLRAVSLLACWKKLENDVSVTTNDFKREVYPEAPGPYETPSKWWSGIREDLRNLPGVKYKRGRSTYHFRGESIQDIIHSK